MDQDNNQDNLDKLASEPNSVEPIKQDYGHSKVVDFLLGFFGAYILGFLVNYFLSTINMRSGSSPNLYYFLNSPLIWLPLMIIFIIFLKKVKRKYIARGVIWAILVPIIGFLLFFGACFLSLGGLK